MHLCESDGVSLRRLAPEDKGLLLKWLSDPVVLEYYEGRSIYWRARILEQGDRHQIIKMTVQYLTDKLSAERISYEGGLL
ncbi:hypothetical protein [Paenibacillus sp. 453mf]|uniref:hypothetical protein n=1 Tax=Paenibacillus sp. 453mf TaxID=1761874 RepID=UPI0008E4C4F5|nr:hypothetical protein [Paenibacillus sp. 453mf]SFS49958.1 aminoglycoside 6'-N-acetyltransferase [Paenibacillus sp. 453mf]